ncbi:MAG: DUF2309 domain-containing protein [bacterium]
MSIREATASRYSEVERLELRSLVNLAGESIAHYWPMRSFIHHNILHAFEHLAFDEAVRQGRRLFHGRGYLSNERFRGYYREGRIRPEHLRSALRPLTQEKSVTLGERMITHEQVLHACLLEGLSAPAGEILDLVVEPSSDRPYLERLVSHLSAGPGERRVPASPHAAMREERDRLGARETLAKWCDDMLGTRLWYRLNEEMIKWCAAFLDEGQATWAMPARGRTFYGAWRTLAQADLSGWFLDIADSRAQISVLPDRSEDAILDSLATLGIPKSGWQDYFSFHLAALPGWTGFLKWRAEQPGYPWQQAYPMNMVKYLAVRLWHERALVARACRKELGIAGDLPSLIAFLEQHPGAAYLRRERAAGRLPPEVARQVDRLLYGWPRRMLEDWDALADRYVSAAAETETLRYLRSAAWRLLAMARALGVKPDTLAEATVGDLMTLLGWVEKFPESEHGKVWLEAFEAGYHERLFEQLSANLRRCRGRATAPEVRPQAQTVFCIDVRSEPFRRNLENVGDYQTFGFAGFFICFIRYQAFDSHHETDQYPVIMKARNTVREIPRSYQGEVLLRYKAGARLLQAAQSLLHDLKENVITPYLMVESLGWFFSLPFIGKTLAPSVYAKAVAWIKKRVVPSVATTLTLDKLTKSEVEEMIAADERAVIRRVIRAQLGLHGTEVTTELIEALRRRALDPNGEPLPRLPGIKEQGVADFVEQLRGDHGIDSRWRHTRMDRITRTGFAPAEQVFTVGTALRMMGLTSNFARLALLCAHGSTSDNNPFEAALDCGACGGNEGKPNARLLAAMANKPQVREQLAKEGLQIPQDTYFLAGQVDTTTDEVRLFDLEDVPPTHRKDVERLTQDLNEASRLTSQERCKQFPDVRAALPIERAMRNVRLRATDWSQVRPEWGLSGNAAFIIARRELTRRLDLEGRVFLHSYDYLEDPTGKLLEILMTAPQVVTQWINTEHYFSTVDNEVYGSGSKVYHNVVGRIGVMLGTQSDLRVGLAWQTVMDSERPYHEPMRLLTLVEAPRERIEQLIQRHEILKRYYHNRWVHLVAFEREETALYRYGPDGRWVLLHRVTG